MTPRSFRVPAGTEPPVARALAARCRELGYSGLWAASGPGHDGPATLRALAEGAPGVPLGYGPVQVTGTGAEQDAAEVSRLPPGAGPLTLAVEVRGSGVAEHAVTEAAARLRDRHPGVRLLLADPRAGETALAVAAFDGVILRWATPASARVESEALAAAAGRARRPPPAVLAQVCVAVGADAETRLAREEGFYADLDAGWREHFRRLGEPPGTVGVAAEDPAEAEPGLRRFDGLDEVVVRALAGPGPRRLGRVAAAAAPR